MDTSFTAFFRMKPKQALENWKRNTICQKVLLEERKSDLRTWNFNMFQLAEESRLAWPQRVNHTVGTLLLNDQGPKRKLVNVNVYFAKSDGEQPTLDVGRGQQCQTDQIRCTESSALSADLPPPPGNEQYFPPKHILCDRWHDQEPKFLCFQEVHKCCVKVVRRYLPWYSQAWGRQGEANDEIQQS